MRRSKMLKKLNVASCLKTAINYHQILRGHLWSCPCLNFKFRGFWLACYLPLVNISKAQFNHSFANAVLYLLLTWNKMLPLFLIEMFPLPLSAKWQGAVLDNTTHATNILPLSAEKWRACYLGRSPWDHLAFYPLTAIQTQMPFMQVPEPCLFVLHNCYTRIYPQSSSDQMVLSSLVLRLSLSASVLSPSARCPWVRVERKSISLVH